MIIEEKPWWEGYVPEPNFDEFCPVGKEGDVAPHMHCSCWYDGDCCCRCFAPGLTEEEKIEFGMLPED